MVEIKCNNCGEIKKHCAKGMCKQCYSRIHMQEIKQKMKTESPEIYQKIIEDGYKGQTCNIIKKHHVDMKDDPESLSTEFIQNIIGIKCDK